MKSNEVYRQLRLHLAPLFKSFGFRRGKAMLSWFRPSGNKFIVVWCQVSQFGFDEYTGSMFVVEFQKSDRPNIGIGRRERIINLWDHEDREHIRILQNKVISSFVKPPMRHPILQMSTEIAEMYMKTFETISSPYPEGIDVWFRYANAEDVLRWAHFLGDRLPACIDVVETWE